MRPGFDLYCAYLVQHFITAGEDLDGLDRDQSVDVSNIYLIYVMHP